MTTPDLKAVFDAAADIDSPADRAAYLDRACAGAPDVRREVEALLRAFAEAGTFLNQPAVGPADTEERSTAAPAVDAGTLVAGRYRLLQQIGIGGMGTVWMADQTEPVKRRVAVKLVRAGRAASAAILSRFEAERQAIALMDHPHIARLLDAGTTEDGSPFFVMELVKGAHITEFCDAHRLSVPDRLELFRQVCAAVRHAHQKGIIHRDLKPSNILVESHDGRPVPKVIDFGLAKATTGLHLTEHTLFTAFGNVLGTPLYMAPEQATFNAVDVDTRADVYALGVILYELLTGTTPLRRETVKTAALDEMLRLVREQEAPAPSSRLSAAAAAPTVATNRGTEPQKLGRFVRGELDWVVMKALEKDRSRRYGSATEFAADVERFLNHEPVQAGPPTVRYRTRKFVRRNRGPVLAAAVVAVALLCGTIGTTLGLVRAEHHWGVAVAERIRAQQAEADTLADYRAATDDAVEQLIGARPELGPKERAYLESTLKRWQAYANRQGDDERSRAIRGEGHFRVAWLWARLGREEEAEAEYRAAIDIRRALVEQFPESPDHRDELARTHQNLGALYRRLGRRDAERAEHEAARDHRTELVRRFPDEPDFQLELAGTTRQLGIDHTELGEFDRARAAFEASRDTLTGLAAIHSTVPALRRGLADSHFCLGRLFDELRQGPAARAEFEAARDLQAGLVAEAPESSEYRQDLAMTHNSLGNLFRATRQPADARREFREAITHFRRLAEEYPGIPEYEQKLAATRSNLGIVLSEVGAWAEARAEFAAASALQTRLVGRFPGSPEYWNELANTHNNWGVVLARDEGKPVEAIEHFDLAVRALQPLSEKNPRDVVLARELSNGYANRARAYDLLGRFSDAARDWDRAVALTPSPLREHYRVRRAIARLQAGLVAEAMAEVAELTARAPGAARPAWDAAEWYDIACAYAIATRTGADRTAEYAARAVEMLRIAVECGYRDAAHMAKDADLDALRGRDDFKALLTDLEKRFPKTPKDQPLQKSGGHSKKRKGDIVSHGRSRCPLFRSTVRHDI